MCWPQWRLMHPLRCVLTPWRPRQAHMLQAAGFPGLILDVSHVAFDRPLYWARVPHGWYQEVHRFILCHPSHADGCELPGWWLMLGLTLMCISENKLSKSSRLPLQGEACHYVTQPV